MSSIFGKNLKASLFGSSHGENIGIVIDNMPYGIKIDHNFIKNELARRRGGDLSTERKEADNFRIVSGVTDDTTTGEPLCIIFENKNFHSEDYEAFKNIPRPSHADYAGSIRYNNFNDKRGGGHFSGRLTAPLVFASSLAKIILKERYSIEVFGYIKQIGNVYEDYEKTNTITLEKMQYIQQKKIAVFSDETEKMMIEEIMKVKEEKDSIGGIVSVHAFNVPAGIGDYYFDSIESRISSALFAIGGVKGVEFGRGFELASMKGSSANDMFINENSKVQTKTNNSGGINGGISNGMPIVVNACIKPASSIGILQKTLNTKTGEEDGLIIEGRHDACIAIRALVVIEGMVALTLLDIMLDMYGRKQTGEAKNEL